MPKNQNKNKKQNKNAVSGGATSYQGPLVLPRSLEQQNIVEINCGFSSLAISSGTVLDLVFGTGLVTSSNDWSSITSTFHEYRVLAMEYNFCPSNITYGGTTQLLQPIFSVTDRQAATALGSVAVAADHESSMIHYSREPFKRIIKMSGPEESVWTATGTTFSWGWVKIYGLAFASNTEIGRSYLKFLVQLRGKG